MTQKEESLISGRKIDEWYSFINEAFNRRFQYFADKHGDTWYYDEKGCFCLRQFDDPFHGFIIEYSTGKSEEDLLAAEDGMMWCILDYESPDQMLEGMLGEIEE